jgi:hypothetical protein
VIAKQPKVARPDVDLGLVGEWRDLVGITEGHAFDAVLLAELPE